MKIKKNKIELEYGKPSFLEYYRNIYNTNKQFKGIYKNNVTGIMYKEMHSKRNRIVFNMIYFIVFAVCTVFFEVLLSNNLINGNRMLAIVAVTAIVHFVEPIIRYSLARFEKTEVHNYNNNIESSNFELEFRRLEFACTFILLPIYILSRTIGY